MTGPGLQIPGDDKKTASPRAADAFKTSLCPPSTKVKRLTGALGATRINLYLASGIQARGFFIGEGPGYYENRKGEPFCGASGATSR